MQVFGNRTQARAHDPDLGPGPGDWTWAWAQLQNISFLISHALLLFLAAVFPGKEVGLGVLFVRRAFGPRPGGGVRDRAAD